MSLTRGQRGVAEPAGAIVYGLVPAGSVPAASLRGVGGGAVEVIDFGDFSALVGRGVDPDEFGTPDDLLDYTRVLDEVAASQTVLPVAFGTFVHDGDEDGLDAMREAFRRAVGRVEGAVQFTLGVRYREDVALAELVRDDPRIARLREQTAGTPEDALRPAKLQLGELVVQGLDRKASADAAQVLDPLAPFAREILEHDRREPDEVLEAAMLVDRDAAEAFEEECDRVAESFAGRTTFRLLGPQAPYDFVEGA